MVQLLPIPSQEVEYDDKTIEINATFWEKIDCPKFAEKGANRFVFLDYHTQDPDHLECTFLFEKSRCCRANIYDVLIPIQVENEDGTFENFIVRSFDAKGFRSFDAVINSTDKQTYVSQYVNYFGDDLEIHEVTSLLLQLALVPSVKYIAYGIEPFAHMNRFLKK